MLVVFFAYLYYYFFWGGAGAGADLAILAGDWGLDGIPGQVALLLGFSRGTKRTT